MWQLKATFVNEKRVRKIKYAQWSRFSPRGGGEEKRRREEVKGENRKEFKEFLENPRENGVEI